ncbi:DUF2971 domain-containing protein [Sedimenticola sp.]|uniref:DUF2971 domain-containing protein n=1 Tax=Sedimenticola sp. TaxID=1940285 RepID=UPI003D0E2700
MYHYTSSTTALDHILRNNTLLLNSYRKVNDPKESKHWDVSPFVRTELNLELEQYDAISEQISTKLKGNAKLVCFSRDKAEAVNACQPEALLNRGFAKPSMWHHYANAHDGVCLMFNRERLEGALKMQLTAGHLFHGPVTYTNRGILPKIPGDPFVIDLLQAKSSSDYFAAIEAHFDRWHKELFLQKLADWSNEEEYRWVFLDNHAEPRPIDFEDALEAIVVGEGVDESRYESFLQHCVLYKADIANLVWHNGYPRIEHPGQPYITHRGLVEEYQSNN